ncbi:hypothetical protein K9M74_04670 [Candidatus Woesearchaeota archaeon]|nr:hypothetical protein [Candidatus Woesearchaeota archaeon]
MRKLSILSLLVFILGLPLALAAEHSVKTDLLSFVEAFKYLFKGSTSGFVSGVVGAIPLLAVVLIVFGLAFFLGKLTIFKDDKHTKYARMIAVGIALIGLATQSVYNAILSWTGAFLNVAFVLAIIFMFIMFLNYLKKNNYEGSKDMMEAQKASLSAKKELKHMQHDFKLDEKERNRVMNDLGDLETKLDSMKKLSGTELQMIDKLADLLRKATTAASRNDQQAAHGYAQMLTKEIGTLITTMKHEATDENALDHLLMDIDRVLDRWDHNSALEHDEEKHLNTIFSKINDKIAAAGADVSERMIKELRTKEESNLLELLRKVRSHLIQLTKLKDTLMKEAEQLRASGYKAKHMEAQAVRTAIFNMQFTEAHNHLDQLRSLVEQEPHIIKNLQTHETNMRHLVSTLESLQSQLNHLLMSELAHVKGLIKKEKDEAKVKDKKIKTASATLFDNAHHVAIGSQKLASTLQAILVTKVPYPDKKGKYHTFEHEMPQYKSFMNLFMSEAEDLLNLARRKTDSKVDMPLELKHFKSILEKLLHNVDMLVKELQIHTSITGAALAAADNLNKLATDALGEVESELNKAKKKASPFS